jgi:hypothetical protein
MVFFLNYYPSPSPTISWSRKDVLAASPGHGLGPQPRPPSQYIFSYSAPIDYNCLSTPVQARCATTEVVRSSSDCGEREVGVGFASLEFYLDIPRSFQSVEANEPEQEDDDDRLARELEEEIFGTSGVNTASDEDK